jgi:osmotically-inducible protein OsmY
MKVTVGSQRPRVLSLLTGALLGAGLAYFFDPDRGPLRRHLARDRTLAATKRGVRQLARTVRVAAARIEGRSRSIVHRFRAEAKEQPDDATLAHKVESILFRDPRIPKGQISINAERGSVFLRGQVEPPVLIEELEARVRKIAGVQKVENLLHLPGTPAPHTAPR